MSSAAGWPGSTESSQPGRNPTPPRAAFCCPAGLHLLSSEPPYMHVEAGERRGIPLHTKILIGLALGALAGVVTNRFAADEPWVANFIEFVAQPVGQIFLRMLFMVVIPLVFTTLALGVAGLGDLRKVGRVGGKTMLFFLFTTTVAALLGLFLANTVEPGGGIDAGLRDSLIAQYSTDASA